MKSIYYILALIVYSALIITYLNYQKDDSISYGTRKIMFYAPTGAMLLFYKWTAPDIYGVRETCFYAVICSIIIIILNFKGIIVNTYGLMYGFFGLVIAVSAIILISGNRHGTFKYE